MIKALMRYFKCRLENNNEPLYSFTVSRYDEENEIYLDIKSVQINVGVTKYTVQNIMNVCNSYFLDDIELKKFIEFFLTKFLRKNIVRDSTIYITYNKLTIRIRNISLKNQSVLRIIIDK
jgi:hypothetical protein